MTTSPTITIEEPKAPNEIVPFDALGTILPKGLYKFICEHSPAYEQTGREEFVGPLLIADITLDEETLNNLQHRDIAKAQGIDKKACFGGLMSVGGNEYDDKGTVQLERFYGSGTSVGYRPSEEELIRLYELAVAKSKREGVVLVESV